MSLPWNQNRAAAAPHAYRHRSIAAHWARLPVACLVALAASGPALGQTPTTRANVSSYGEESDRNSYNAALSEDGSRVAFDSDATNLVLGDTNQRTDVFVHDRTQRTTTRVSVHSDGSEGNDFSFASSLSADGRTVAFASLASNLVADDTNGRMDVFVHDLETRETRRVNVSSTGAQAIGGHSWWPALSGDGRYVAFASEAKNLVAHDTNGAADIFVHDLIGGLTWRVSVDGYGNQSNDHSYAPSLSYDGSVIAFESAATNLIASDTNGWIDIFVHDRTYGTTERVTLGWNGEANGPSDRPSLSGDGTRVAFESDANNLVSDDFDATTDVFVYDRATAATTRVSTRPDGAESAASYAPALSRDGASVAFQSDDDLLDIGAPGLVYVRELASFDLRIASVDALGRPAHGYAELPAISSDGRHVAFESDAANLVPGDENSLWDIFVQERTSPLVSTYCTAKENSASCYPRMVPAGDPSAAATSGFFVSAVEVLNEKPGLLFYSLTGEAAIPFQDGYLCVAPPVWRASGSHSGGNPAPQIDCSGIFSLDMNAYAAGQLGGAPRPELRLPGTEVFTQWWGRDPGAGHGTTLADGLRYTVGD